jgi:hypothetical protein
VLIRYNMTLQHLFVAQKVKQKENDAFKVSKISNILPFDTLSLQQQRNRNICSTSKKSKINDLRKEPTKCRLPCNGLGYEQHTTILVCDGDGKSSK